MNDSLEIPPFLRRTKEAQMTHLPEPSLQDEQPEPAQPEALTIEQVLSDIRKMQEELAQAEKTVIERKESIRSLKKLVAKMAKRM